MGYLKIGELAKKTGTSTETLRFYESKALIAAPRRSDAGYRLYTSSDVARIDFIVKSKRLGFSLKEIEELLSLRVERESTTCGEVKKVAEAKLVTIENKLAELTQMKSALQKITDACCGGETSAVECTILNSLDGGPTPKLDSSEAF